MTAAYFEDHPTDPDKMIMRKPKHDFGEPWAPVSIGVDVTKDGVHVVGIYALDADTSQIFYAKHHPVPQRTWVGLTDEHKEGLICMTDPNPEPHHLRELIDVVEFQLKEKNT
jgi:hypothetical protein